MATTIKNVAGTICAGSSMEISEGGEGMNQKDQRIRKLYEHGMRNKADIARKIGYGAVIEEGVRRVEEGFRRLGIESPNNTMMDGSEIHTKSV